MLKLSLPPNWIHRHFDSVDSTMLCCDPSTVEPFQFLLITADEQTAGRGQRGTTWESSKGQNLTFNIGWRPSPDTTWPAANEQFLISEITALAVVGAIEDTLSEHRALSEGNLEVKWPNDIYFGDRKICGMLLEHQLSGKHIASSIAGIGINVNQASFATLEGREEGRGAPISLHQIIGHNVSREAVLEAFIRHFTDGIRILQEGHYDKVEHAFTTLLYRRTGWHHYRDAEGEFIGEFASIARNGILTLRKQNSHLHSYAFKEVAYVI